MKSFSLDTPSFATFSAISAALHQKVVTENLGHGIGGHDPVKGKSRGFPGKRARRWRNFLHFFCLPRAARRRGCTVPRRSRNTCCSVGGASGRPSKPPQLAISVRPVPDNSRSI